MHLRIPLLALAALAPALAACASQPPAPKGMFDLSNVPMSDAPSSDNSQIPQGRSGGASFATGVGSIGGAGNGSGTGIGTTPPYGSSTGALSTGF